MKFTRPRKQLRGEDGLKDIRCCEPGAGGRVAGGARENKLTILTADRSVLSRKKYKNLGKRTTEVGSMRARMESLLTTP